MATAVSSVDVALDLFAGLDTELSPPDVPEGVSPANNDVVFAPGRVSTRPGLEGVFASLSDFGPITYEKSFVSPVGNKYNLYFTQGDHTLWVENLSISPGSATVLWAATPNTTYASSCTCSGREYIALSDGVHGADIVLQFDGQNIYRVTLDGPGAPPTVASIVLPPSQMAVGGATGITIAQILTTDLTYDGGSRYYTALLIEVGSGGFTLGQSFVISGNSNSTFNGLTVTVDQIVPSGFRSLGWYFPGPPIISGTGGTGGGGGTTAIRKGNTVTINTTTPHGLVVGYQAQITGMDATQVGGGVATIVLKNADSPGIATVTTVDPHGLLPGNQVQITGVTGNAVGSGIATVARAAQIVTVTTNAAHGLAPGSQVKVDGVTDATFDGQFEVLATPSSMTFTYYQFDVDATSTGGTITYIWPFVDNSIAPNYFQVQTAPTDTTFTITINYTDGSWTGGIVTFGWDGTFFVTAVPSTTSFQYLQYGPDAISTTVGTVTPYGQATPGLHQLRVSWLLVDGTITAPSPPVSFVANGGQYPSITGIPIGPSPIVVARILQFTGAGGAFFFHIPVPAQVNGIQVSTSTQVNDNVTSAVVVDFSDNTLYGTGAGGAASGTADSVPGNNLAAQVVLGPCAGIFTYASRLMAWGERNKVQNFLNMGFDGGWVTGALGYPLGWTVNPTTAGSGQLISSRLGTAWQITLGPSTAQYGNLSQSAYADTFGGPVLLPNQAYTARFWANVNGTAAAPTIIVSVSSASTAFSSSVVVPIASLPTGAYYEADLSTIMPSSIPSDLVLQFWGGGTSSTAGAILIDDLELIFTDEPFVNNEARISYVGNFGAFDGETGVIGPEDDTSPIRNFGVIRQTLYMVTGTGLHETQDNDQTEPNGWTVDQVADNCGAFSVASVGRNPQGIGSAGKTWMAWSGPDGGQIFFGQLPVKITQEIQSLWDAVPDSLTYQCWTKNDESAKRCYFGIPTADGTSMYTVVLDYRNLDGESIAFSPPVRISFTGKMIASDLTRKWTWWSVPAWCGELLYHGGSQPEMTFGCKTPSGAANAYTLNSSQYHDDDFGIIPAKYTTYFFVDHEKELALQLGSHRKVYTLAAAYIIGTGTWTLTPYMAALTNPQNTSPEWPLSQTQGFDQDFGINVETTRCAFQIEAQPIGESEDAYFSIEKLVINMAKAPWAPVRGSMSGVY